MLIGQWSTAAVAAREQFDFARGMLMDTPMPVRLERPGAAGGRGFVTVSEMHAFGADVGMVSCRGEAATGIRGEAEIARGAPALTWLLQYRHSAGTMLLDGRPFMVGPGDIIYGDGSVRQHGDGAAYVEFDMWMLPTSLVTPLLATPEGDPAGVLRAASPLGQIVAAYVRHLAGALDALPPERAPALIGNLAALLALDRGIDAAAQPQGEAAIRDARLAAIRRDILRCYADPALSPRLLARRHGLSLRSLHLLFEPTGVSCARFIQGVRLDRAHAMLARGDVRGSVADLAFACGFESLSTFYRAFRARYGCRPTEMMPPRRR